MFAYCLSNPTNCIDPTGNSTHALRRDPTQISYDYWGGGGGGGIALATIALGAEVVLLLQSLVDALEEVIAKSYAHAASRTYKQDREIHHLVARKAKNATLAAEILNQVLPGGVENPINKISIKTGLHRRLHTNLYYAIANQIIISAYNLSDDPAQQQQYVVIALGVLRGIVASLDIRAPY